MQRALQALLNPKRHLWRGMSSVTDGTSRSTNMESVHFEDMASRTLPVDPDNSDTQRQVAGYAFVRVTPTPVQRPIMVATSSSALALIDLEAAEVTDPAFVDVMCGNHVSPGANPVCHVYCGHQYGLFSGQLGDGAVCTLGTIRNQQGALLEVQLKGCGRTPFSRVNTDGRKVLRSSIREFLCSEAMHFLGVPTTRAATCVLSDTMVSRDINYTGAPQAERAAVVTRLAPSFLRVGSLEVCRGTDRITGLAGPSAGNVNLLTAILSYVIHNYFPEIEELHRDVSERYLAYFKKLVELSAHLTAKWQTIGFCHGVLNTDNISLVGVTMDYGPFGFMDTFNPDHICNDSDFAGCFAYNCQPKMVRKALDLTAEVMAMVLPSGGMKRILDTFDVIYHDAFLTTMRSKLGLTTEDPGDSELIEQLFDTMRQTGSDFTQTFRALSSDLSQDDVIENILGVTCSAATLREIHGPKPYPSPERVQRTLWLLQMKPDLLPVYMAESRRAIDEFNKRAVILHGQKQGESEKAKQDRELWKKWVSSYDQRVAVESEALTRSQRVDMMKAVNPRFILHNHVLQRAIRDAENGDFRTVRVLLKMSEVPYSDDPSLAAALSEVDRPLAKTLLDLHDNGLGVQQHRLHVT